MTAYPPGPYEVIPIEEPKDSAGNKFFVIRAASGVTIATVYPANEGEAIARLFASAPRLAAAVADMTLVAIELKDRLKEARNLLLFLEPRTITTSIDEAIAKVEFAPHVERAQADGPAPSGEAKPS
jgi:hypothetical protein